MMARRPKRLEPDASGAFGLARVAVSVFALLVIFASACSSTEPEEESTSLVETVDAAAAAGRRPSASDAAEPGDQTDPGAEESDAPSVVIGDGLLNPDDDQDATAESSAGTQYPEITEEITPAPDNVRALLTPTGVLLGVTGVVSSGFVVVTPCGGQTVVSNGETVGPAQIVIDPGHGGDEAGAEDVPGLSEAALNLSLAQATATELRARGISVVMIRDGDYRVPISVRAQLADLVAPEAFMSIHHNTPASADSDEPGTEVYVQTQSEISRRLGGLLYEEVFGALNEFDIAWTARDDAGVLTVINDAGEDSYGINRRPSTPTALVEMAYLGNEAEAEFLGTQEYLDVGAQALADGLERFLTTEDPGSGFVEAPRIFNPSGATGGVSGCVDPSFE